MERQSASFRLGPRYNRCTWRRWLTTASNENSAIKSLARAIVCTMGLLRCDDFISMDRHNLCNAVDPSTAFIIGRFRPTRMNINAFHHSEINSITSSDFFQLNFKGSKLFKHLIEFKSSSIGKTRKLKVQSSL